MSEAAMTIQECCIIRDARREEVWTKINESTKRFTTVVAKLGRKFRDWPQSASLRRKVDRETLSYSLTDQYRVVQNLDGV